MRTIFYTFLIFFLAVSCNKNVEQKELIRSSKRIDNVEQKELIGSWKRTNLDSQYPKNYSQKTTFTNDSLIFEEYDKKKLVTRINAKYKFDEVTKIINYDVGNTKIELKVLKLNNSEMELLNINQKKPMRFKLIK